MGKIAERFRTKTTHIKPIRSTRNSSWYSDQVYKPDPSTYLPSGTAEDGTPPDPALKGVYQGNCNVTMCQEPGATWWNWGSRAYYCRSCAWKINEVPLDGKNLCRPGDGTEINHPEKWD